MSDTSIPTHLASIAPTTLLSHPVDGSSANCLAQAMRLADEDRDELLFLSGPAACPSIGHVILRDRDTGLVREAHARTEAQAIACLEAYTRAEGRRLLAAAAVSTLRSLLARCNAERASLLARLGAPLADIGDFAFGISSAVTTPVQPLPKPPPPPEPTTSGNVQDQAVKQWLDAIGDALPGDQKQQLAHTADDASTLLQWFNAHKRGDPAINADMPQNVKDAETRLQQDKTVGARLVSADDPTTITRDAVGNFVSDLDDSANNAKDSWNAFIKNNPNPDAVTKQRALDASILQANIPVFDAAGGPNAAVDGYFDKNDLKAIASSGGGQSGDNAHLPSSLANAAAFYLNDSEFDRMEVAGVGRPDATTDGLANTDDLKAQLSNGTWTPDQTAALLQNDALEKAVADAHGDASKFGADYFNDPSKSNATGADKTAALVQLQSTLAKYDAGVQSYPDSGYVSDQNYFGPGPGSPSPGQQRDDFRQKIVDRITTLSQDSDVASFVSANVPKALQSIVGSDPGLHAAVQAQYDSATSSKALNDAFGAKDQNGNPFSTTDALANFERVPSVYAQALGIGPDDAKSTMEKALSGASEDVKNKVTQGYDDITSGKEIEDLTKSGTSEADAIVKATGDKTVYDMVLDKQTVADGTDKFNGYVTAQGRGSLTDGKSVDDMLKGYGINGVDDPKLTQFVQDNIDSLTVPGPNQPKTADIVAVIRNANDFMRGGLKFDDAMTKAVDNWAKKVPDLNPAYKTGVFHGASGLLLGGALTLSLTADGRGNSPTGIAQTVQQSLQAAGLLTEGGAKYYQTSIADLKDSDNARFQYLENLGKSAENVGKGIGGVVGNAMGCVLGAIGAADSAKQGDVGGTITQSVFAGLNGIATIASAGEVASFVAPRIATALGTTAAEMAGAFGSLGGVAGAIGGVLGIAAFMGMGIYSIVQAIKSADQVYGSEDNWYKQLQDGFAPAGVPLPNELALTDPADGPPPLDPNV